MAVDAGDTAWMLISTAFVLFMTLPGLAMFYGGLVRSTGVLSVFFQCFTITCIASLIWVTVGYSLAFGHGGAAHWVIGNWDKAFMNGVTLETTADAASTIPETVFVMFQMTFAIITPSLIAGAYPERVKYEGCTLFSTLWLLIVYIPVTHWVWGGGWLADMGVMDFAGGIVVHCTAGWSALVFAYLIGPRTGFEKQDLYPPHQPVMTLGGAAMLWVGWFGFNAGSAVCAGSSAGMAMLATHASAAAASLSWCYMQYVQDGKPTSVGIVTGMVAGLAAVTPASGFINPVGGLYLGLIAGVVCERMTRVVKDRMGIDDSIDVFAVHGVGGMLGAFLVAIMAQPNLAHRATPFSQGLTEPHIPYDIWEHVKVQSIAIIVVSVYSVIVSYGLFKLVEKTVGVRVSKEDEATGLDPTSLGERAYDLRQTR
jgi:Amt family ammonium transporter